MRRDRFVIGLTALSPLLPLQPAKLVPFTVGWGQLLRTGRGLVLMRPAPGAWWSTSNFVLAVVLATAMWAITLGGVLGPGGPAGRVAPGVLSPMPVLAAGGGACTTSSGGQVTTWVPPVTPPGYYVTVQQWYQPPGYNQWVQPAGYDISVQQWYQPPGYWQWVQHWYQPPGYNHWVQPGGWYQWVQPGGYERWVYHPGYYYNIGYEWIAGYWSFWYWNGRSGWTWHSGYWMWLGDGWVHPYYSYYWYQPPGYYQWYQPGGYWQWYQPGGYWQNVQQWYQPPGYYRTVQQWYQPPGYNQWVQPPGYYISVPQWYQPPTVPGHNVTTTPSHSACLSVGPYLPDPSAPVAITGMEEHFWLTGDTSSVAGVTWTFGGVSFPLQGMDVWYSFPMTGMIPYSAQITWADGATATVTGTIQVKQVQSVSTS